jgi:hypothetical protein
MGSDQYRREIATIEKEIGRIRGDISKEEENARKARSAAAGKRVSASRATGASKVSNERQADTEDKKVVAAEKKVSILQGKLASVYDRLSTKQRSLQRALRTEEQAKERVADQKRRKDKADQVAKDREDTKRRQVEKSHARELAQLNRSMVHSVIVRQPEPEKLRVLYLTASPPSLDLDPLRVDSEVNNVLKALRAARHKDLVELHHRPAATVGDLVDGLNDHRPHVVHFSGHADGGLLFDTADPLEPGDQLVGYLAVARILAATDRKPTLIVLNACRTVDAVKTMLEAAPVVIGTCDAIGDASAQIFATHFYGAIAAAQSVGHAVAQAREILALALPDEPDVIHVSAVDEVNPDQLFLIKPT